MSVALGDKNFLPFLNERDLVRRDAVELVNGIVHRALKPAALVRPKITVAVYEAAVNSFAYLKSGDAVLRTYSSLGIKMSPRCFCQNSSFFELNSRK